jgi:hypothetical protein
MKIPTIIVPTANIIVDTILPINKWKLPVAEVFPIFTASFIGF